MAADAAVVRRRLLLFTAAVLGFLLLVPVPAGVSAVGSVEARGARFIYPPRDVRVIAVAPAGKQAAGPALQLESPDLADAQRQANIRGAGALARWRQAIDLGEDGAQAAAEAAAGQQAIAAALAEEEAMLAVPATAGWDPLDAQDYVGSWVSPNLRAPLAVAIPEAGWRVHAVVPEGQVGRLREGRQQAGVRVAGRPELAFLATIDRIADRATQVLPSDAPGRPGGGSITVDPADPRARRTLAPMVEIWLVPEPGAPALRHGQRLELRLGAPARPLA